MQSQMVEESKAALQHIKVLNEKQEAELNGLSEQNKESIAKVKFMIKQTCLIH